MENGEISKLDMIKSLKKGLLITELMGSSINYSNGDYSRGASGFWIENGEICYPVSEITIAGNLVDIFMSLIPANDLEFNFGINAPSCLVENLTLGGK
jgi:PmbA protein